MTNGPKNITMAKLDFIHDKANGCHKLLDKLENSFQNGEISVADYNRLKNKLKSTSNVLMQAAAEAMAELIDNS